MESLLLCGPARCFLPSFPSTFDGLFAPASCPVQRGDRLQPRTAALLKPHTENLIKHKFPKCMTPIGESHSPVVSLLGRCNTTWESPPAN